MHEKKGGGAWVACELDKPKVTVVQNEHIQVHLTGAGSITLMQSTGLSSVHRLEEFS